MTHVESVFSTWTPVIPSLLETSQFYVSKNYGVKYIKTYIHEEHTQKSPVKKYFIFQEIQKKTNS
jgi:hypothetical protein